MQENEKKQSSAQEPTPTEETSAPAKKGALSALFGAPSKKQQIVSYTLLALFLAILVTVFFLTRTYLEAWPISGTSMDPTIHDNDKALLVKTDRLEYGDVIIFRTDEDSSLEGKVLIKRIIGKPGDTIDIQYDSETNSCHVYRNGQVLDESYIKENMRSGYGTGSFVVPEGYYYVLGDNRNVSLDSHLGIYANIDRVEGKILLRYTSVTDMEVIKRHAS